MNRRTVLQSISATLAIGLAGCTGDESSPTDDSATRTPTAEPTSGSDTPPQTATATENDKATATTPPSATESPAGTSTPRTTADASDAMTVIVGPDGDLRFEPKTFEIGVGATVRWVWESSGHNVSPSKEGRPDDASWPGQDEQTYGSGHEYTYTFDVPGEYAYHCDPHRSLGMTGSFTVSE